MTVLTEHRNELEQKRGELNILEDQMRSSRHSLRGKRRRLKWHEQAREIVRLVGLQTQKQLQYHISDISSLALEAIFGEDAYKLKVDFVQRRNKMECDLLFVRDENEIDPLTATGGGAVDVAAFALRVASWSMQYPHTRPTIILDEPFKNLDKVRQVRASQMIKQLADQLGLQFIIVTHEKVLIEYADKAFQVIMKDNISEVQEIE